MILKKVGSLIVSEDQNLKGILTEGDIIKAIAKFKNLLLQFMAPKISKLIFDIVVKKFKKEKLL